MGSLGNAGGPFSSPVSPSYANSEDVSRIKSPAQSDAPPDMRDTRCSPTFTRLWVGDTICGCKIFETVLNNSRRPVERRPTDTERAEIIKSGNVFVYKEKDNGIKRWTDGLHWSPSRISGNFLVYRELPGPFPPGHKKKALKRTPNEEEDNALALQQSHDGSFDAMSVAEGDSSAPQSPQLMRRLSRQEPPMSDKRAAERSLYGSLTKSYEFKEGGLMKKTMSVLVDGQPYHLVAYYDPLEVRSGDLKDSSGNDELANVRPRPELLYKQSWRAPLDFGSAPSLGHGQNPQSYQGFPHPGMQTQLGYQPAYGFQSGMQHHYGYGLQQTSFNGPPYDMSLSAQSTYPYNAYSTFPPGVPQSATESVNSGMAPPTAGHNFQNFAPSYTYNAIPGQMSSSSEQQITSAPTSPIYPGGYTHDFHSQPPTPSSRAASTTSYTQILPSQNPRRADGKPYQSHQEQSYGFSPSGEHAHSYPTQEHNMPEQPIPGQSLPAPTPHDSPQQIHYGSENQSYQRSNPDSNQHRTYYQPGKPR